MPLLNRDRRRTSPERLEKSGKPSARLESPTGEPCRIQSVSTRRVTLPSLLRCRIMCHAAAGQCQSRCGFRAWSAEGHLKAEAPIRVCPSVALFRCVLLVLKSALDGPMDRGPWFWQRYFLISRVATPAVILIPP